MAVVQKPFGFTGEGEPVTLFCLKNAAGASVAVLDYGCTVQSLLVPNAQGGRTDVVLGYDTLREYEENDGFLGAAVGRMGNRVGRGKFTLNGTTYSLALNDGENHLHGGCRGFDKRVFQIEAREDSLICSRLSPDGEEGYPGNLQVRITYTLTEKNELRIAYDADTDADTIVNLTNHSYFNLAGGGSVLDHLLRVSADRFTENDRGCLPTGRFLDVAGTPFDFRVAKPIGRDLSREDLQLEYGRGYDHNFVLTDRRAAELSCAATGIRLSVETDRPGVQVYSANSLAPRSGKGGAPMGPRDALCLETQLFPNAMACPQFPSPVLRAGEHLHTETCYRFSLCLAADGAYVRL